MEKEFTNTCICSINTASQHFCSTLPKGLRLGSVSTCTCLLSGLVYIQYVRDNITREVVALPLFGHVL